MAVSYNTVTVTSTATQILDADNARRNVQICNTDNSTIVYIGSDSSVTTANGMPLYQNQTRENEEILGGYKGAIYGIVSSGSVDVRYFEYTASF